jgi:hypothetical protein
MLGLGPSTHDFPDVSTKTRVAGPSPAMTQIQTAPWVAVMGGWYNDERLPMTLSERIEAIEQAYELMLAYAAQGRQNDDDGTSSIRTFMQRASAAMEGLSTCLREAVADRLDAFAEFIPILESDARAARAAFRLALAQRALSSQLVDNLNASIHIRALLTDVFLIDEALKDG